MKKIILISIFIVACSTESKLISTNFRPIGHRGAAGHAPENTLSSMAAAQKLGLKEIELDVQLTKDKQVVLFHDKTLDKKTRLSGPVSQFTLTELNSASLHEWFNSEFTEAEKASVSPIISLDEALKTYKNQFYYHIEIKSHEPDLPRRTIEVIENNNVQSNLQISSFDFDQLLRVKKMRPKLALTYLVRGPDIKAEIYKASLAGLAEVGVAASDINEESVGLAKSLGLAIRGWGVKKTKDLEKLQALKVYGSTLDYPDWVQ